MADAEAGMKTIKLIGDAAKDYQSLKGGTRKRRTRRSKVNLQDGGYDEPDPSTKIDMRSLNINSARRLANASNPTLTKVGGGQQINPSPIATFTPGHMPQALQKMDTPALKAANEAGTLPPQLTAKQGGGKPSPPTVPSVVLAPKKKKHAGIVLAPPSASKKATTGTRSARASKRIRVQLSNMKKRITTAKIIHKDSKEKSIEEIRSLLEEAKLVKPASSGKTVPEEMLRSIYRDYLILRSKAL